MNILKKIRSRLLFFGFVAATILIQTGCSPKYGGKLIKGEKWVNWQIEFQENTSQMDKNKALLTIDNYILEHIIRTADKDSVIIKSLSFSHNIYKPGIPVLMIRADRIDIGSTQAPKIKPIPPLPPIITPVLKDIFKNMNIRRVVDQNTGSNLYQQ